MEYKVIISPRAIADLRDIVLYISPERPETAKRLGYALTEKTKSLSHFPHSGGIVREFGDPNIRQLVLPPYRIIYRIDEASGVIGVARYWHGAKSRIETSDVR